MALDKGRQLLKQNSIASIVVIFFSMNGENFVFRKIKFVVFLPKQCQKSRSILLDGSRSLGLFRKGKTGIIAKFHRTDLVVL